MSLLDLYIEKSENYSQEPSGAYLFDFTANFRTMQSFEDGFRTFKNICAMTDEERQAYMEASPESAKTFISNMIRTKLFRPAVGAPVLTEKGRAYEHFLNGKFNAFERWLLDFMFIADAYFSLVPNYVFKRSEEIFGNWKEAGYTVAQIYNAVLHLFSIKNITMKALLDSEYAVMITFIDDPVFLRAYRESSEAERKQLHAYVITNYENEKYSCIVTAKFSPSLLIDCETVLDDAKILFFAHYLSVCNTASLEDAVQSFTDEYSRFFKVNNKRINKFIAEHQDVFKIIYINLFTRNEQGVSEVVHKPTRDEIEQTGPFDYTTTKTMQRLAEINYVLTEHAKEENGYKCELDAVNHCKYFTDRQTDNPYCLVHRIIPREFAGEFNVNIERASNYVPLCPHCYSLIHNAADHERFEILSMLYDSRRERLEADGIIPTNELLFAVYGIERKRLRPGQSDVVKPISEPSQPKLDTAAQPQLEATVQPQLESGEALKLTGSTRPKLNAGVKQTSAGSKPKSKKKK